MKSKVTSWHLISALMVNREFGVKGETAEWTEPLVMEGGLCVVHRRA